MENKRAVIFLAVLVACAFEYGVFYEQAESYGVSAHAELTKAMILRYEALRGDVFTKSQEQALIQGSEDEDGSARFFNHFYDPISERGLRFNFASTAWAVDILEQANWGIGKLGIGGLGKSDALFSGEQDYTWQRAVYEYTHGDTQRALQALGHVLHLVEDATVPAHVRDDAHPYRWGIGDKDYYEAFTHSIVANDIVQHIQHATPRTVSDVPSAIIEVATFTNKNFLSKDTMFHTYALPARKGLALESSSVDGKDNFFGKTSLGKIVRIRIERNFELNTREEIYSLEDKENKILSENFEVLSRHASEYGMGVLDLFFREVEQEKKTGALLAMNKSYYETERIIKALAFERDSKDGFSSLAAADIYELNKKDLDGAIAAAGVYGIHVPTVARVSPIKEQNNNPASALLALQSNVQRLPLDTKGCPQRAYGYISARVAAW